VAPPFDGVTWNVERPADLAYAIGFNPCRRVVRAGVTVTSTGQRA
jgi:hypothetical protein